MEEKLCEREELRSELDRLYRAGNLIIAVVPDEWDVLLEAFSYKILYIPRHLR